MKKKLTFAQLTDRVTEQTGLSHRETLDLLHQLVETADHGLIEDRKVHIAGLGTFKLKWAKPRKGRNPQTRETIQIPGHDHVVFKADAKLRAFINREYEHLRAQPIEPTGVEEGTTDIAAIPGPATPGRQPDLDRQEPAKAVQQADEKAWDDAIEQEVETLAESEPAEPVSQTDINAAFEPVLQEPESIEESGPSTIAHAGSAEPQNDSTEEAPETMNRSVPETAGESVAPVFDGVADQPFASLPRTRQTPWKGLAVAASLVILLGILFAVLRSGPDSETAGAKAEPVARARKPAPAKQTLVPTLETVEHQGTDHRVTKGDKLWSLSGSYYRNAYLWPNIYRTNRQTIQKPHRLSVGTTLRIPALEGEVGRLTSNDRANIAEGYVRVYVALRKKNRKLARRYLWVAQMLARSEIRQRCAKLIYISDWKRVMQFQGRSRIS